MLIFDTFYIYFIFYLQVLKTHAQRSHKHKGAGWSCRCCRSSPACFSVFLCRWTISLTSHSAEEELRVSQNHWSLLYCWEKIQQRGGGWNGNSMTNQPLYQYKLWRLRFLWAKPLEMDFLVPNYPQTILQPIFFILIQNLCETRIYYIKRLTGNQTRKRIWKWNKTNISFKEKKLIVKCLNKRFVQCHVWWLYIKVGPSAQTEARGCS